MTPAPAPDSDDRDAIRRLLVTIREAWTGGLAEELGDCFHEAMVIVPPGPGARVEGREACVRSYADFLGEAVVTEYRDDEPTIDLWGDSAVASYRWEMTWEMSGRCCRESGRDLFVLVRDGGRWRAAWRTTIPQPGEG